MLLQPCITRLLVLNSGSSIKGAPVNCKFKCNFISGGSSAAINLGAIFLYTAFYHMTSRLGVK